MVSTLSPSVAQAQADPLATQTISLPTGPGSIDGLGESFEPQLNTGSYVFRLPIKLPPVRGKAQPEVSMTYNSGNGNGPIGLGWDLRVPHVQRQTDKGLPDYLAGDRFITGDGEELVARADGTYRRKVETDFTKWQYFPAADRWEARRADGTRIWFGQTAQSRQGPNASQTFRWMLESAEDTNGNRVEYDYLKHEGQIYLAEVRYGLHTSGPGAYFRLVFAYDDNRPDKLSDYRGRYKATTAKRLRTVTAFFGARQVRHWRLDYHEDRPLTLLARFTAFGDERANTGQGAALNEDFLPPVEFEYADTDFGEGHVFAEPGPFMNISLASGEARLVDLNRDGLPDVLLDDNGRYASMVNRGHGQAFGPLTDFAQNLFYPSLSDPATRLADLRGDGTLKLLVDDGGGVYYREFLDATTLGEPVDFGLPGGFQLSDPAIQTVDINNSRAMDFMAVDVGRFSFIISGGGDAPNGYFESPPTPVANVVDFNQGWQLTDLNGDRMPDLAVIGTVQGGGVVFYPGMGLGQFDAAITMTGGAGDSDLGPRGRAGLSLVDLDGDGLSDLVMVESGIVKIWPNRSGFAWGSPVVIDSDEVPFFNVGATAVRFADMNGNGSTDIVWNDPGEGIFLRYLDLHPQTKPNVMTRMRNGMGRELEIEYRSSVDYMIEAEAAGVPWTLKPPFPIPVVSAFTERDGLGSTYRTEVSYRDGYYDGVEREFRGFERAVQTEVGNAGQGAPSLVSEFFFDTGEVESTLKGVVRQSELRDTTGHVFHRIVTGWQTRAVPGAPASGESRQSAFPVQTAETTTVIEGSAGDPVTLFKQFGFDDYGNQTLLADFGRVEGGNPGTWDDERITRRTFTAAHASGLANWILNLPVTETIEDLDGIVVAESHWFYDDESFAGTNPGAISKGNLTLLRRAIDPATGSFVSAQRQTYDAYGNPIHLIDPLGTGPGGPHSRTIAYDETLHTHPVSEAIHIGGAVVAVTLQADYDLGLGVLTESRDFNGHATFYRYDPFGRLESITKPGDTLAAPTESYDFRLGMPIAGGRTINWIETRQRESAGGGTVDSRTFFDGLGRKVMRRAEGEGPGQIVVSDTVVFNDRRTEWKKYLPYFEQGTLEWADPGFSTPFQECLYDALGRQIRLYQPDTGNGRSFAESSYGPLTRLVRDENQTNPGSPHHGAGMRYTEDGLRGEDGQGRLRVVEEIVMVDEQGEPAATQQTWTTHYRYDTLDNFTGYTDSNDNVKSMRYDGLSRRVFMQDPNRGLYWWAFDAAGNVLRTCDAKGQQIAFSYDGANRITAEWHLNAFEATATPPPAPGAIWANPPAAPNRHPEVSFHYDAPNGPLAREGFWRPMEAVGLAKVVLEKSPASSNADVTGDGVVDARDIALRSASAAIGPSITATNTLGRLAWVRDLSGQEHLSYDSRGRAVWKVKRFDVPEFDNPLWFHVENAYDSMDRLTRHTYADGTYVDYDFNPRGLLESVTGAFSEVNYNPSGQNARIALVNGVVTDFLYDPRLRVERITSSRAADGLALQDREFSYDDVSNITGINDQRSTTTRAAMIAGAASSSGLSSTDLDDSLTITYDSLYRMTSAAGPGQGSHGYRFDKVGNMIAQTYRGDPRFRPESTGALQYGGPGRGPQALARVVSDQGAPDTEFGYDANGNLTRIIQGDTTSSKEWDPKDRLVAASEGGIANTHTYDYASKRVIHRQTRDGGNPRLTLYIDDVSEFRDGRLVKYIYVGREKVARADFSAAPGTPVAPDTFFLHDHLGSTLVAMDPAAAIRQISSYAPYGRNRFTGLGGSSAIDYGFSGKESHDGPDLAYFETRFLAPDQARFTQTDTLTLNPPDDWRMHPQKWHPYSYTWGNPMTMVDKDGREATSPQSRMELLKAQHAQASKGYDVSSTFAGDLFGSGSERIATSIATSAAGNAGTVYEGAKIMNGDADIWETINFALTEGLNAYKPIPRLGDAVNVAGGVLEIAVGGMFAFDAHVTKLEMGFLEIDIARVQSEIHFEKTVTELTGNNFNKAPYQPPPSHPSLLFDQPFDTQVVRPFMP